MNPFTESTVARPWTDNRPVKSGAAFPPREKRAAKTDDRRPPASGKRRPLLGLALAAMGLMASLCLSFPTPAHALDVDVNTATQVQLRTVRGIGPKTAQIIIEERSRGGRYESFEDLSDRVKGIGPKKAASLQAAGLTLGGPDAAKAAGSRQVDKPAPAAKPAPRAANVKKPGASRTFKLSP